MLFKKKKTSILPSFSIEVPAYEHSSKFIKAGKNPVEDERKIIASLANSAAKSGSFAVHQLRDSSIEAEGYEEIAYGRKQYYEHVDFIRKLAAMRMGELELALSEEALILGEIEKYESESE